MVFDKITNVDFEKMCIYGSDINNLILCLQLDKNCISSISCNIDIDGDAIEISSSTCEEYSGKKYNKLLRYVAVLLCHKININNEKKIKFITSTAINQISAIQQIYNLDARPPLYICNDDGFITYLLEKKYIESYDDCNIPIMNVLKANGHDETDGKKIISGYYDTDVKMIFTRVFIDDEIVQKSYDNFISLVMNDDFKNKYIKYKMKYLSFKNKK